jgi:hypothetical protein
VHDAAETMLLYRRATPEWPTLDVALELGVEDTLTSPQLPGFALPLVRVFQTAR